MTLNDPVGNSVELRDLKPFTIYNLDVRARTDKLIFGTLNFSTASKFQTLPLTRKRLLSGMKCIIIYRVNWMALFGCIVLINIGGGFVGTVR